MKKLLLWSVPVKSLAAMLFAGFIFLYMMVGGFHAFMTEEIFEFSIPFAFTVQSAMLSALIAMLYASIFSEVIIKKMRYFRRMVIFLLVLTPLLAVHVWLFYSIIWMIIAVAIGVGILVGSLVLDKYFKLVGKKYTNALEAFKTSVE